MCVFASAPPLHLQRLVTLCAYGARFSHLRRSVHYGCWSLVPNCLTELPTHFSDVNSL